MSHTQSIHAIRLLSYGCNLSKRFTFAKLAPFWCSIDAVANKSFHFFERKLLIIWESYLSDLALFAHSQEADKIEFGW